MKKISKILVLMLALVVVVSLFTACSEEKQEGGNTDPTEDIKAVVDGYLEALSDGDMKEMLSYVDEDSKAYDKINDSFDYETIGRSVAEDLVLSDDCAEDIAGMYEDAKKETSKVTEGKVDKVDVAKDGKSAVVKVSGTVVDDDAFADNLSNKKLDEIFQKQNDGKTISSLMKAASEGIVTPKEYDSYMLKAIEQMFEEAIDKIETKKFDGKEIELELIDDEWKITEIED